MAQDSERKLPTIRDVATAAGVSHMTVSRVLNAAQTVRESTRSRVLAAISELGYVPSPMAQGLIANRSHALGLVSAEISDPFFAEVVAGAEVETRRRGYYLMVASVEDHARDDERGYLHLMLTRRVEGLIVARPTEPLSRERLGAAIAAGVPLVAIGSAELPGFTLVDVDNRDGGRQATEFLIRQGHRQIATISPSLVWPSARNRLAGYRQALTVAGLRDDPALVEVGSDWGPECGREGVSKLLDRRAGFTALFAQNDLIAIGAMRALRERGLDVPGDVSVVGYDDISVASYVHPPLTTIRQPMREVGALAARIVLDQLTAREGGVGRDGYLLPATLVVRDSVVPPKRQPNP